MSKLFIEEKEGVRVPVAALELLFDKQQMVFGDLQRDLILRTAGTIKIQVGNKFFDLPLTSTEYVGGDNVTIVNGAKVIFLNSVSNLDTLVYPGDGSFIYTRDTGGFYISLNNEYTQLNAKDEDIAKVYLSFTEEQTLTGEQKYILTLNAGGTIDNIVNVANFDTSDVYENMLLFSLEDGKHYRLIDKDSPTLVESWEELYLSLRDGGTVKGDVYLDNAKLHVQSNYIKDYLPYDATDYDSFFIGDSGYNKGLGIWKTTNNMIFSTQESNTFGYKFITRGGTANYYNPLSISNNSVAIGGNLDYGYSLAVTGASLFKNKAYFNGGLRSPDFFAGAQGVGWDIGVDSLGEYTLEIDKLFIRNDSSRQGNEFATKGVNGSLILNHSATISRADLIEKIDVNILGSKAGRYSDASGTVMPLANKTRYVNVTRIPIANLNDEGPSKVTQLMELAFGIGDQTSTGGGVVYNTYAKQSDGSYGIMSGTVLVDTISVYEVETNVLASTYSVGDLLYFKSWDASKQGLFAVYAEVVVVNASSIILYCYNNGTLNENDVLIKLGNKVTQECFIEINSTDKNNPFIQVVNNIASFNDFVENYYYTPYDNETSTDKENMLLRKEQVRFKAGTLKDIVNADLGLTAVEQQGLYSDNAYIKGKFQADNRFMLNNILVWDGVTLNLPGYVKESRKISINGVEYDLSADRSWTIAGGGGGTGTVTSVGMSVPTGFAIGNSPITTAGTLALTFAAGYSLPTTAKQANWDTAFGWGNHATQGYIKTFTETDPTVPSHVKAITTTNISNWNNAFSWGNHALAGYVPQARTITINGTTFDLTANRTWTISAGGTSLWDQDENNLYPLTTNKQLYYYVSRPNGGAAALFFNTATNGQGIIVEADTLAGDFQGNHATLEALRASNNSGGPIATFTGNSNTVIVNNTGTISGYTPTAPNHLTTKKYVDDAITASEGGSGGIGTTYLWGQSFNGTQDVSGSLTGVTTISATDRISTKGIIDTSLDGVGSDPYGPISVTRGTASNFSYFGLTRSGQVGIALGINTSNEFVIGGGSFGAGIMTSTFMRLSTDGLLTANSFAGAGTGLTGTAANLTSGNSLAWNTQAYLGTIQNSGVVYTMVYDGSFWRPGTADAVKSFLNLPDIATSFAYGQVYDSATLSTTPQFIMGYNGADGKWHPTDTTQFHKAVNFTTNANTVGVNTSSFTYASNAPQVGNLVFFGSNYNSYTYGMQLNSDYGTGRSLSFRTHNGDTNVWNDWRPLIWNGTSEALTFYNSLSVYNASIHAYNRLVVSSQENNTSYTSAALEIREVGRLGAAQLGPRIALHHAGVVASQISLQLDGTVSIVDNPGTAFEKFKSGAITIAPLSGEASAGLVMLGQGGGATITMYYSGGGAAFRQVHTNSDRIGFLTTAGGWGAWTENDGAFQSTSYINAGGAISGSRVFAGWDSGVTGAVSANNWFRSQGPTGWYSETFGGGIYMADTTWVRVSGTKAFLVENTIQGGQFNAGGDYGYAASNYGNGGLIGVYASDKYQAVFAMGGAYKIASDGTSLLNNYGLSWTYQGMAQAKPGLEHQLILVTAGITRTAIGVGIWTSGNITAVGGTFTAVVAGVTPTAANHLTTKQYVDNAAAGANLWKRTFISSDWRLSPSTDFDGLYFNKDTVGAVIEIETTGSFGIRATTGAATSGVFSNNDISAPTVTARNQSTNANARIMQWTGGSSSQEVAWMTIDGALTSRGGFFDISDIRLKNLLPYTDIASEDITAIKYTLKEGNDKVHYGYSAQEVQKVMPDAVGTDKNGTLTINYTQVHTAKIQRLEEEVKQLKKKLYGVE